MGSPSASRRAGSAPTAVDGFRGWRAALGRARPATLGGDGFWSSLKRSSFTATGSTIGPRPAGRSSLGSTATASRVSTRASATAHPSSGRTSTVIPKPTRPRNHRYWSTGDPHYEFDDDWWSDHSAYVAILGAQANPLDEALSAIIDCYRPRSPAPRGEIRARVSTQALGSGLDGRRSHFY